GRSIPCRSTDRQSSRLRQEETRPRLWTRSRSEGGFDPGQPSHSSSLRLGKRLLEHSAERGIGEHSAGANGHARKRVVGYEYRHCRLVGYELVQPLQQRAAAGQNDATVEYVGGQLWWSAL